MTNILTAYRRADGGIAGAALVVLFSASAALAISQNDDQIKVAVPVAQQQQERSLSLVQSPVELAAARMAEEHQCLAEAMYFEARGEGEEGQKAVAEVVLARTQSRYYPSTICGVVHQGAVPGARFCQFTFACDGSLKQRKDRAAWDRSRQLAANILAGAVTLADETDSAIAYHTVDVTPIWAATMLKTAQIGNHIFYRRAPYSARMTIQASAEIPQGNLVASGELAADPVIASDEIQTDIKVPGAVSDGA
jgi:spore germination cell wall hydrolase CwlJ-like protein